MKFVPMHDKIFRSSHVLRSTLSNFAPSNATLSDFETLGLLPELVIALSAQQITVPTPVQRAVIPRLLAHENIVMAASTGSGKTLAYVLPAMQNLALQEQLAKAVEDDSEVEIEDDGIRKIKRPRCLILVPTRELARQVLQVVNFKIEEYILLSKHLL